MHWRVIQEKFYGTYKASLGPWTYEGLISYLDADFKNEENLPFSKEKIKCFSKVTHKFDLKKSNMQYRLPIFRHAQLVIIGL